MSYQNINQYVFNKFYLKPSGEITDVSLASDENDYDKEVLFSPYIIGYGDGNRMPISFDFNSTTTSKCIGCGDWESDVIVSENYFNPKNLDLITCGKLTTLCDVGLTGVDNGLVQGLTGETIEVNSGLYIYDSQIYNRYFYDRRFKMHPIAGFTTPSNRLLNDNSYTYDITTGSTSGTGTYVTFKGGFYQGFYKLSEYDYQVLPERYHQGWSTEFLLRHRWTGNTSVGLNARYPQNKGTFFYMGARAENKFYHFSNGAPKINYNGTWKLYIQDFVGTDSGRTDSIVLSICNSGICSSFSANTSITIPDLSVASTYPITFNVTGITENIENISVTFNNFYHPYPGDLGILLVSPNGAYTLLDAGGFAPLFSYDPINVTLTNTGTTLWNDSINWIGGEYLNDSLVKRNLPFLPPSPYQFFGNSSRNLTAFTDDSYFRVTDGLDCLKTCACSDSAITQSNCGFVYQQSAITSTNNICPCGCGLTITASTEQLDPLLDSVSNALSIRLSGDTGNPRVCVKTFRITGGCETTGSCETTGITYTTGTSVSEWCSSAGIFDDCEFSTYSDNENWVQINAVFVRDTYLDDCDLKYKGGLDLIVKNVFTATSANNSVSLVKPPLTHDVPYDPVKVNVVNLNEQWIDETKYRKGKFKIYVNGKLFMLIDDFEEIIPRPLNTEKEKQIGVPFNISLGGGTQGLKDNLTFLGCPEDPYFYSVQQDPECLPTSVLTATTFAGLETKIHLEELFGGSFIGDMSAFRFYTEPLNASQIAHNFSILKEKYNLLDPDCVDCEPNNKYLPIISSFSPGSGFVGDTIQLIGKNFNQITTLFLNNIQVTNLTIQSDAVMICEIPTGSITGYFIANSNYGYSLSQNQFVVIQPPPPPGHHHHHHQKYSNIGYYRF
jgi:hypothetical protein